MLKRLFGQGNRDQTPGAYRHGNSHLIELRQVSKAYPGAAGSVLALKNINLLIDTGEFVAVIGKSGSGKSTLINMITGVDHPSSGEVLVGDVAVHRLNENRSAAWRGRNVGVVYQSFQLVPTLTVIENVMLPMDFCDTYPSDQFNQRALYLLEQVDIAEQAYKFPATLSGGQQQRAAIARALANDPLIVVADEPTGNLDSRTADAVFHLFEQLASQGKTMLMVTHDTDITQYVRRIITITDGVISSDDRSLTGEHGSQAVDSDAQPVVHELIE